MISPTNDLHFVTVTPGQNLTGQDFADVADPQITDIVGQNLVQAHGSTPQFDQDGTLLHIIGRNFDPGSVFFFGNDQSATQPINLVADRAAAFSRSASTFPGTRPPAPWSSSPPTATRRVLLHKFTVDSYRNVNGYSFVNDGMGYSDYTFDDLTGCTARTRPTSASTPAASSLSASRIAR